uniref:FTH domain-containing protein n=1 Tax=Panagrellus redivivus TaxID=6233 RepID=A0A7E4UXT5_PANRE
MDCEDGELLPPEPAISLSKTILGEILDTTIASMRGFGYDEQHFGQILKACFASRDMFFELWRFLEVKVKSIQFVDDIVYIIFNETNVRYELDTHGTTLLRRAIQHAPLFEGANTIPDWFLRMLITRHHNKMATFNVKLLKDSDIAELCELPFINSLKVSTFNERTSAILSSHSTVQCFDFVYVINQRKLPSLHKVTCRVNCNFTDYNNKHRDEQILAHSQSEYLNSKRHYRIWENLQAVRNLKLKDTLYAGVRTSRWPFVCFNVYSVYVMSNFSSLKLDITMKITFEDFANYFNVVEDPARFENKCKVLFSISEVMRLQIKMRYVWIVHKAVNLTTEAMVQYGRRLISVGFECITANEGTYWAFRWSPMLDTECIVEFKYANPYFDNKRHNLRARPRPRRRRNLLLNLR